jgi:hypothetical protein
MAAGAEWLEDTWQEFAGNRALAVDFNRNALLVSG